MQYVNFGNVPEELKQLKQWVLWRYRNRGGGPTKVPFQATGVEAKANDRNTWSTFDAVRHGYAVGNWEGIGFEFADDDPYTGIDLDGCRDPETKVIEAWAKELILKFNSYAEVSPSMTGVKIWVRGQWNYDIGNKVFVSAAKQIGDKKPAIEVYDSGRYFAMTGVVLQGQREIRERQVELDQLREQFWPNTPAVRNNAEWRSEASVLDRARKYVATIPGAISGAGGHDTTFKVACTLVLGFDLPDSDAMNLLSEWNQTCQPPWSERDLQHKIQSASQQGGDRGYLRNVAPKNYERVSIPEYKPAKKQKEIEPEAEIRETVLEDAARMALSETVSGRIKLVELGLPDVDYALGGGVEAGEMIILAARPSHGKSLCAAQVIHHQTANGIPCMFVSEEMSSRMIGKRTIQFASDVHTSNWAYREDDVKYDIDNHFASRAPCYIIEGCKTVSRVAHEIRRYATEKNVGLVVVDYAQLLKGVGSSRYEQQTNVSDVLKKVGQESGVVMIVLCQMSRKFEERKPCIPNMSDIKETGAFEQDADVIIFQVWPHKLNSEYNPKEYHLFIAKNRNREIMQNFVRCEFEPQRQRLTGGGGGVDFDVNSVNFDEPAPQGF